MTCIAGVAKDGVVVIGGDSAGVGGWSLTVRADEKVFRNGECIFGFTSSFRMGQLLRYAFSAPARPEGFDDMRYLTTVFVDGLRSCLKAGGFARTNESVESGGSFLLGYRGGLYTVHSDYQVAQALDGCDAVGCGEDFARGALYATAELEPQARVEMALAAAERCSAGVRGPFHFVAAPAEQPASAQRRRG